MMSEADELTRLVAKYGEVCAEYTAQQALARAQEEAKAKCLAFDADAHRDALVESRILRDESIMIYRRIIALIHAISGYERDPLAHLAE